MIALLALLATVTTAAPPPPISYSCNGTTTAYTIQFPYLSPSHLIVTSTTAGGVVTTLGIGGDYTVTPTIATSTGTVKLTAGSKCPSGSTIKIDRLIPLTQPQGFRTGSYQGAAHEQAFDRLEMQMQQVQAGVANPVLPSVLTNATPITPRGGTTALQLQDFLAPAVGGIINVKAYGCAGNGTTDDTACLQAAINAAMTTGAPLTTVREGLAAVYLPPGTYKITSPLQFWSVQFFTFMGSGAKTVISVGAPMTAALDLNGVAYSTFKDFRISGTAPTATNTFTYGVYVYWDNAATLRSTTGVRFNNIVVINGQWVDAFHIGKPGVSVQEDTTEWTNCRAEGAWASGENTWWQSGFHVGSGVYGNNLIHNLYGAEITFTRYGIYAETSQVSMFGGMLQWNEANIYTGNISGYSSFEGFRSEHSQRLYQSTGQGGSKHVSISNVEFKMSTTTIAADRLVINSLSAGTLILHNVAFESSVDGTVPKPIFNLNPSGGFATLILDGVSTANATLPEVLSYPSPNVLVRGFTEMDNSNTATKTYSNVLLAYPSGSPQIMFGKSGAGSNALLDTGLSRVTAGVIGVGNGTAADTSGTFQAAMFQVKSTNGAGTVTLAAGAGSATTFTGARCICTDTTAANAVKCSMSGTTLSITGTGTDVINYACF